MRANVLRAALIGGGYVFAFCAGVTAVWVEDTLRDAANYPGYSASSAMVGFGDLLLFLAVAGGIGLIPTAVLIRLLARAAAFRAVLSWASLGVGATAVLSVAALLVRLDADHNPILRDVGIFASLRMFLTPLLAPFFLITAVLLPAGASKRRAWLATAMECVPVAAIVLWVVAVTR